jgi:hypothetical protein
MSTKLTRYAVLREHDGDRFYREGETRDARPADVAHLVGRVLEEIGPAPAEKAEPIAQNKAEGAAPANKASGRKAKTEG